MLTALFHNEPANWIFAVAVHKLDSAVDEDAHYIISHWSQSSPTDLPGWAEPQRHTVVSSCVCLCISLAADPPLPNVVWMDAEERV